jgi:hypothetical protein
MLQSPEATDNVREKLHSLYTSKANVSRLFADAFNALIATRVSGSGPMTSKRVTKG